MSDPYWGYLPSTNPSGVILAPEAIWRFDGVGSPLLDLSTNGHNLTVGGGGATSYQHHYPGYAGLTFKDVDYYTAANNSGLIITGALTLEFILYTLVPANLSPTGLISCGKSTWASAVDNVVYAIAWNTGTSRIMYQHEYDSGGEQTATFYGGSCIIGPIYYFALTRSAPSGGNQIVKTYINGKLVDSATVVATHGGSAGTFYLGRNIKVAGTEYYDGIIFSARITKEEFSADSITEAHNLLRGL